MVQKCSDCSISVTDSLSFISGGGIMCPSAWHPTGFSDVGCGVRAEYVASHYKGKGIFLIINFCPLSETVNLVSKQKSLLLWPLGKTSLKPWTVSQKIRIREFGR